jgi:hypothetical protein
MYPEENNNTTKNIDILLTPNPTCKCRAPATSAAWGAGWLPCTAAKGIQKSKQKAERFLGLTWPRSVFNYKAIEYWELELRAATSANGKLHWQRLAQTPKQTLWQRNKSPAPLDIGGGMHGHWAYTGYMHCGVMCV